MRAGPGGEGPEPLKIGSINPILSDSPICNEACNLSPPPQLKTYFMMR